MRIEGTSSHTTYLTPQEPVGNSCIPVKWPDGLIIDPPRSFSFFFSRLLYRVQDFCTLLLFSVLYFFKGIFCGSFCKNAKEEEFIIGHISQFNAVRRGVFRFMQPGSKACAYISSQAVLQFLQQRLENPAQIDEAVFQGIFKALNHYGIEVPESIFSSIGTGEELGALQEWVLRLDQDPAFLDRVLSRIENREWFEISSCFQNDLVSSIDWTDPDQLQSLCQDRFCEKEAFYARLQNFASLGEGPLLAGLFIAPPYTYALCIEKDYNGVVRQVFLFDSHGYPESASPGLATSAYMVKWKKNHYLDDPLDKAAEFLWNLRPTERFMITPLQLRRDNEC